MWMLVPVKNGGGLGVGEEVMGYVRKNTRKHRNKGEKTQEMARRNWTEWVDSHRKEIHPGVNNTVL